MHLLLLASGVLTTFAYMIVNLCVELSRAVNSTVLTSELKKCTKTH